MTLRERLLASAAQHGDNLALWTDAESLTYEALFARAESLSKHLSQTLPTGAAIGIHMERETAAFVGILAAVLSNRPYIPLSPSFPLDRLKAIVDVAKPGAILTTTATETSAQSLLEQLAQPLLLMRHDGTTFGGEAHDAPDQTGTAYLMFTSGTTGTPKGVRVLTGNLCAYLDSIAPIANLTPQDRATQFFDLSFDLSVHDIFVTLCSGASMHVLPKARSMAIVEFAVEQKLTTWFSVPSLAAFCERLKHLTPGALPDLKTALFCGEPLPVALTDRFMQAAPNASVWNLYGPTEATIAFTALHVENIDDLDGLAVVPLGAPIGDQRIKIDDTGELLLGGTQVTPGYINARDQNESKFLDIDGVRFYRSGDIVEPSERFVALYKGRIDDQLKINGYRVELLEIDAAIRAAADTPEVAAVAWPISETGQADQIIAFVCQPKQTATVIRKHCRDSLPTYMVPRKVIEVEKMPLTASGKIDRRQLVKTYLE